MMRSSGIQLVCQAALLLCLLLITSHIRTVDSLEPITTGIAAGGAIILSAAFAGFDKIKCSYYECCNELQPDFPGLERALRGQLVGQHLVLGTVIKTLKGHFKESSPSKALVLSFHGWTGNGKNFVSRLIAENLYHEGSKSRFVHLYISTLHFPHRSRVEQYQDELRKTIREKVGQCERTMFIFDEMDKMPPGVLDALTPFLDYHQEVEGVDYRKSIYIFLSNTAGTSISERTFKHWDLGHPREEITLKEMEDVINKASFNVQGGLWHSRLIEKNLITAFVPFLPMEYRHVKECVRADLKAKNHTVTDELLERVASQLEYFPPLEQIYSTTGCKRVPQKVDYIIEEMEEGGA